MQENLYFYYTNDLHSNFEQWPRVATYFNDKKTNRIGSNESYWFLDIGDHMDRVHPITEAFMGRANVQLMNDLGYDLVTIGNNEGITLPHEDLYHLYDRANFDVVCSNLHSKRGLEPAWLNATKTIESIHGVKIGVIGLTAPFNDFYELLDWHVSSPYEALDKYIKHLKKETDIIILLSHLGLSEDEEIARRCSDIDLIIGGHTHHLLRTGKTVENTLITAAGKHCSFVGEVRLTWDHSIRKLTQKEAYAIEITHLEEDIHTLRKLKEFEAEADKQLGAVVAHIDSTIPVRWFEHTEVMQHLTNKVKSWTDADCAMLNGGLLLDDLPYGTITFADIHRICPHPINPCVVQLTGAELIEVVRVSLTKEFTEFRLKGFGFRGEVLGKMIFSGMEISTGIHKDGATYVKAITINGIPLDHERVYRVATADTFTFGRLFPEIAKSEVKEYFVPEFLRDLFAEMVMEQYAGKHHNS